MENKKIGRPKELLEPKGKFTLYMTKEVEKKFNQIFAFRVMAGSKDTKSDILCQAVEELFEKEFKDMEK